jgi:hypothetical protein
VSPARRAPAAGQAPEAVPQPERAPQDEPQLAEVWLLNGHTTSTGFTGPGLATVPLDEAVRLQQQGYGQIVGL